MTLMLKAWCPGSPCDPCNHPSCSLVPLHDTSETSDPAGIIHSYSVPLDAINLGGYGGKKCSPQLSWLIGVNIPVMWSKWQVQPDWTGSPGIPYPSTMDITVTITCAGGATWSVSGNVVGQDIGTAWGGSLPSGLPNGNLNLDGTAPPISPGLQCVTAMARGGAPATISSLSYFPVFYA